jgi:hypothetical protein
VVVARRLAATLLLLGSMLALELLGARAERHYPLCVGDAAV